MARNIMTPRKRAKLMEARKREAEAKAKADAELDSLFAKPDDPEPEPPENLDDPDAVSVLTPISVLRTSSLMSLMMLLTEIDLLDEFLTVAPEYRDHERALRMIIDYRSGRYRRAAAPLTASSFVAQVAEAAAGDGSIAVPTFRALAPRRSYTGQRRAAPAVFDDPDPSDPIEEAIAAGDWEAEEVELTEEYINGLTNRELQDLADVHDIDWPARVRTRSQRRRHLIAHLVDPDDDAFDAMF